MPRSMPASAKTAEWDWGGALMLRLPHLLECLGVVGVVKESMNVSISLDGKATVSDVLGMALGSSTARTIRLSLKIAPLLYRGHRV